MESESLNFRFFTITLCMLIPTFVSTNSAKFRALNEPPTEMAFHENDSNITFVKINQFAPISANKPHDFSNTEAEDKKSIIKPEVTTINGEDDLKATDEPTTEEIATTNAAKTESPSSQLSATTLSSSNRIGKLQEEALRINQGLTDRSITKRPRRVYSKRKQEPQIIRIQPFLLAGSEFVLPATVPTRQDYTQHDNNIDKDAVTYKKINKLRGYKSNCRCEKIWNCPKLQISVHRCPHDYFMCCF